jgi:acetoacetate decarboxylase
VANKDGIMNLEVVVQKIDFGSEYVYNEMILSIPVEYNGIKSVFHILLYLNKFNPITTGREIWGFPKHYADIKIENEGQYISATISQGSSNIITLNAQVGESIDDAAPVDRKVWFVHKKIPSIERGEMDIDELNAVFINDFKAYNTKTIEAELKINSIPNEDIGTIPILRIIESKYFESDFILGAGETLVNFKEK